MRKKINPAPWQAIANESWQLVPLKRSFDIELGQMLRPESGSSLDMEVPYLKSMHVQWDGVQLTDLPTMWATATEIENLRVEVGDLLVCEGGDVGRAALVTAPPPKNCIIQNALHRVRGKDTGSVRFLRYLLRHAANQSWFDVLCNRATIAHFTVDKFKEMQAWLPSVEEQEVIANFLDHELQRLDQLAEARQLQLVLLEEKRRAIIAQAVTQGLDAQAPRRDSGFSWLGSIPAHWQVVRLKYLGTISYGLGQPPEYVPIGVPFIRATNVTRGIITEEGLVFVSEEILNNERTFVLKEGDIIVVRSGAYTGDSALVSKKWNGAIAGFDMVFRSYQKVEPAFISYSLLMPHVLDAQIDALRMRAAQPHLNAEELGNVLFPLPPKEEQVAICRMIEQVDKNLSVLRTNIELSLDLLQQKRASLITAAVTGQLTQ